MFVVRLAVVELVLNMGDGRNVAAVLIAGSDVRAVIHGRPRHRRVCKGWVLWIPQIRRISVRIVCYLWLGQAEHARV